MRVPCGNTGFGYGAFAILFFLIAACGLGFAYKDFVKPHPNPAASYPAHDQHPDERVTVAVDPYDMPDKASIFSVNYRNEGLLPIFLVITNDSDQPVSLAGMKPQLVTVDRAKIPPSTEDDVYRRLSHPSASPTSTYPLPFPRKKVKGAVSAKTRDEITAANFDAKAVEPHSSQSGFLFFDVGAMPTPLAGAHFYLTGIQDGSGNELMYFEIPMEKYLSAPAKP
jgi:hypothetical protein